MTDGKDEGDASDWLSSQFTPTEQVPKQETPEPAEPAASVPPPLVTPPPTVAPAVSAPAHSAATPPTQAPTPAAHSSLPAPLQSSAPQPSAPEPNAAGGFNWGLRPGGATQPAAEQPVQPAAPPPATVPEPPAALPPTQAYSAPLDLPTQPFSAPVDQPTQQFSASLDQPTQPLSWDEFAATQSASTSGWAGQPTEAYTVQPTEAYTVQPVQPTEAYTPPLWQQESPSSLEQDSQPASAIDSLFGDHQFQSYEEIGLLDTVKAGVPAGPAASSPTVESEPRAPLTSVQKALMAVAGGLIVVLILIGMFFLGQHIGSASAAAPASAGKGTSTNTPTPAGSGGPASPGVQEWSALQGGECIQPFSSAWAATFTVVNCSSDHDAQMVFKGKLPDSADTAYPSASQFQTELTGLCSAPTAINYAAAAAVTDLQISFSYPPSQSKWIAGDRTYYCFVDRQSGGNLPGDLSVPSSTSSQ